MKKIKILLIALILVLGGVFLSNTYAVEVERELGAQIQRPFTPAEYMYTVKDNLKYTIVKIFDTLDKDSSNNLIYSKVLYCLRGGVGFGTHGEDVATDPETYKEIGEFHKDADKIIAEMNKYKTGENGPNLDFNREEEITVIINDETIRGTVKIYNAVLWILDEAYLPRDKEDNNGKVIYSESEYKEELLNKAGVPKTQQDSITKDDIEAIQQLAMWYFANYDEQKADINPTVSQATMNPAQFLSIDGNNNIGDERANNLDRIYQYFIKGAIENSNKYETDSSTGIINKRIEKNEFEKQSMTKTSHDDLGLYNYYEIGPVQIKGNAGERKTVKASDIKLYDATGKEIKDFYEIAEGQGHNVYRFVDTNGDEATELTKGINYYIRFYKAFEKGSTIIPIIEEKDQYDMSEMTLKVTTEYYKTTATFLSAGNSSQPIVEIDRERIIEVDEIKPEDSKDFDLSLRKFITSIERDNKNVEIEDRTPSIDVSKLNTEDSRTHKKITTATYTHPKNALLVETGDKVI